MRVSPKRIRIRASRVLGRDGRPKTGKSKRDVVIHGNLAAVLRQHQPFRVAPTDFVFTTPTGSPIDEANFYQREWLPMLRRLQIRPRPFYNTRHTYISYMVAIGANPLFIVRQTGTSLQMIEDHYGSVRVIADELDELITTAANRNPTGTLSEGRPRARSLHQRKLRQFRSLGKERATGVEPATSSLGSWHSTAELRPHRWELQRSER